MTSPDAIELRGLRLAAVVGVLPHEQAQAQPLEIDLDLHLSLSPAGTSDDLALTADYGAVCAVVAEAVEGSSFALLEALAEHIAAAVLGEDGRIEQVVVAVRKLRPPVPQHLATSGVRITRP